MNKPKERITTEQALAMITCSILVFGLAEFHQRDGAAIQWMIFMVLGISAVMAGQHFFDWLGKRR